MSFGIYILGYIILIVGLALGAHLLQVPLGWSEVDEVVDQQQWESVIVLGRYEELPDTSEWQGARAVAYKLLHKNPMWWEPAYVQSIHDGTPRPLVPIVYRIHIARITGHRATPR